MKVHIRRAESLEVYRIEVVNLRLIKTYKKGCGLTHGVWNHSRTTAHLKLRSDSR